MGAIISKLCCCTGKRRRRPSPGLKSPSKLSRNPSLIIERTQVLRGDEDGGGSEYSRVLEKDFEIRGRRVVVERKSQFYNEADGRVDFERSDSIIKVAEIFKWILTPNLVICRLSK